MDRQELRQTLLGLVDETTGESHSEISDDQDLQAGLGLDSVDMFSLIVEMQSQFKIKIATEDVMNLVTVGDLLDLLETKVGVNSRSNAA